VVNHDVKRVRNGYGKYIRRIGVQHLWSTHQTGAGEEEGSIHRVHIDNEFE